MENIFGSEFNDHFDISVDVSFDWMEVEADAENDVTKEQEMIDFTRLVSTEESGMLCSPLCDGAFDVLNELEPEPEVSMEPSLTSDLVNDVVGNETAAATDQRQEKPVSLLSSVNSFSQDANLIIDTLILTSLPQDPAGNLIMISSLEYPAAVPTLSRRKQPIRTRNVTEDVTLGMAVREKREHISMRRNRKSSVGHKSPAKMHQLDPIVHPEAKGAVYSKNCRDKKKKELHDIKEALAIANRELFFVKSRLASRDKILERFINAEALKQIQTNDDFKYSMGH